jgi:hypothetical protein
MSWRQSGAKRLAQGRFRIRQANVRPKYQETQQRTLVPGPEFSGIDHQRVHDIVKSLDRSRTPSGSFQNDTGIEGIGLPITSSPISSRKT